MAEFEMQVRIARAEDLASLVTLRCALWPDLDSQEHEERLRRRFESGARFATMVLVNTDGQLCGFVELMRDLGMLGEPSRVSLQAVFVAPPVRRRAGATQLLEAAQRWAQGRGASSLYCDLPFGDEQARENLRFLGFAESEGWIRATRVVSAPLEVKAPRAAEQSSDGAVSAQQADEPLMLLTHKTRGPLALTVNVVLFIAAVVAFANTNIYSNDLLRGMVLPLLDVMFVFYFLFLFVALRYRKRADSSARADQLFRADD